MIEIFKKIPHIFSNKLLFLAAF